MSMIKPAVRGAVITPSDSASNVFRAIYVGGTGNLAVQFAEDSAPVTLQGIAGGIIHPISTVKVLNTGTTATNLVGLL